MKANNFDQIYSGLLWELYTSPDYIVNSLNNNDKERKSGYRELNGYQFKLTDITNNTISHNKARGFKLDYAKDFFNYVLTGDDEGVRKNPKAVPYLVEFAGRNTQYGPRIRQQLPNVLEELIHDKESRRATILVLDSKDQDVLEGKRLGISDIEYPCTNSLTFSIRNNKLHLVSNMRSQSAYMVLPYEIYNWTNLMVVVCDMLKPHYPGLECGILTHQMASVHYFDREEKSVKATLAEYGLLV
jgi:hypothetical protein